MSDTESETSVSLECDDSRDDEICPEILKTSKGKDLLTYEGFIYYANRKPIDNSHYWECRERAHKTKRDGSKCPSRVVTQFQNGQHHIISQTNHNHGNDPKKILEFKMRNTLKRRALEDSSGPAKVIRNTSADFPAHMQSSITTEAQRKMIKRTRAVANTSEKEPETLEEFCVPDQFTQTLDGDRFLLADIVEDTERALIYTTSDNIRKLSEAKYWVCDGTFDTVPGHFRQLFTIHASIAPSQKHTYPMVYVLMSSKTESLYRQVFSTMIEKADELEIELNPHSILTDLEKALINACKAEFPDSLHHTCFFHLSQNLWKHVQSGGLQGAFSSDVELFIFFKKIQALAFLPWEKIPEAFEKLKKTAPTILQDFVSYFETTYVSALWSVYDSINNEIPRTTNQIEAWHRRWNGLVGSHVGILKMLKEFQLEEKHTRGQILALMSANSSRKRKTDVEENDRKIMKITKSIDL
ncbi:AAEL014751-PA [Aedes aegypti]|uniref:AAEL014751-PA n=1 Tax=Aedes aegypti TaxID=7159 RepID=Q16FH8_AEDAE|nr:AAEL014751-PA [Aedes aegypti]